MSTPNPGSQEARNKGCTCPVRDNCHGKFPPYGKYGWVIVEDCPVHSELAASQLAAGETA